VSADFTDDDEEAWVLDRRTEVERYLAEQGPAHGRVADWPAWHIAPYVSIWAPLSS
jgi:hypothetical protein